MTLHATLLQTRTVTAASAAVAGIVVAHATAISRTTVQCTCRQWLRPPPTPTIEDATTCVVEIGAPMNDPPSMSDARSLEDTLDRAWTVASTLPREDLSMVSPRVLDARYRPAGDADPRPAR
jgi:hypothetical protein